MTNFATAAVNPQMNKNSVTSTTMEDLLSNSDLSLDIVARTVWRAMEDAGETGPFTSYKVLRTWMLRMLMTTNVETLFSAVILAERFLQKCTPTSLPALYATTWLIAHKNLTDICYTNKVWAYVCEHLYDLATLNTMELEFLKAMNWDVHVSADQFQAFVSALASMTD
eukprot:Rmarinus@m.26643